MTQNDLTDLERVIVAYYRGECIRSVFPGGTNEYRRGQGHPPSFDPDVIWEVVEPEIELSLTMSQAIVLHTVLRNVGGSSRDTWRGLADSVRDMLEKLDVPHLHQDAVGGSITAWVPFSEAAQRTDYRHD
jgi:hypothetical protein